MKHHLQQQTILLTLLAGAVGLTAGCTSALEKQAVVCDPAVEGSCVVSYDEPDKYLAQDFAAYETAYLPKGATTIDAQALVQQPVVPAVSMNAAVPGAQPVIALSEPAKTQGISVQEKQVQQQLVDLQKQVDAAAAAQARQLAEAEAKALNEVMTQVAAVPVYYDPTTGQYVPQSAVNTPVVAQAAPVVGAPVVAQPVPVVSGQVVAQPVPVVEAQIVATEQPFVAQEGMLVGGNDLNGQIVVANVAPAEMMVEQVIEMPVGQTVETAPEETAVQPEAEPVTEEVVEEIVEEVVETPLDQKILFGEDVQDWDAPAGESLRSLLMQWGDQSGWTVIWKLDRDYTLEAGVVFRGTFVEAASAFIRSFARATPAPIGTFYKGNRVLVMNTQEGDNAN